MGKRPRNRAKSTAALVGKIMALVTGREDCEHPPGYRREIRMDEDFFGRWRNVARWIACTVCGKALEELPTDSTIEVDAAPKRPKTRKARARIPA